MRSMAISENFLNSSLYIGKGEGQNADHKLFVKLRGFILIDILK